MDFLLCLGSALAIHAFKLRQYIFLALGVSMHPVHPMATPICSDLHVLFVGVRTASWEIACPVEKTAVKHKAFASRLAA